MKRVLTFLLLGMWLGALQPELSPAQSWMDPAWGFRRPVAIANTSGITLTDYQVRVTLDAAFDFAKARADGSDVRCTAADGSTQIPFWIESWDVAGTKAILWTKVPSIPSGGTTIYLYYGNSAASSASDGSATFMLFDDSWLGGIDNLNPVQTSTQSWWESVASYPMLFEDTSFPDRPRFHMLYDGHDRIGHAKGYTTSPDLVHWTAYDNGLTGSDRVNPIMGVGYHGNSQFAWGDAIKIGSTYHMFPSSGPGTTVHAQSSDLVQWTDRFGGTVSYDALVSSDPSGIGTGVAILKQPDGITPVIVDGKYWMVYAHGFSAGYMYLAYTDAGGDLLSWTTCYSGNPVLAPSGWEGSGLWTPSFVKVGDAYYIYYQAGSPFRIGFAKAPAVSGGNAVRPDATTWTKSANNPVITNTHGWDNGFCQDPTLRCFDGTYYLFYTGDPPWTNGFATSSSPEGPWIQYGAQQSSPAQWARSGNPGVSNGVISFAMGQSVQSVSEFSPGCAVGFRARFYSNPSKYKWGGFMKGNGAPLLLIETLGDGSNQTDLTLTTYASSRSFVSLGPPPGTYHNYEIAWLSSVAREFTDHAATPTGSLTSGIPSVTLPVQFTNNSGNGDPLHTVDVDWMYVRKYNEPEPGILLGAEEAGLQSVQLFVNSIPSIAAASQIYPGSTWRATASPPLYQGADDWSVWGGQSLSVYAVPSVGVTIGASDMTFEWDPAVLALQGVDFTGSVFTGSYLAFAAWDRLGTTNKVRINASLVSPHNAQTKSGDYLARLDFTLNKPGHSLITAAVADFRFYNPDYTQSTEPVTQHSAELKAYLGDVASSGVTTVADGKLDINDLSPWSTSYWSGVDGYAPGMANYKAKYDIGPTMDGTIFALPAHKVSNVLTPGPDGKIDFEDLMIFAMTYGASQRGQLPKTSVKQESPIVVVLGSDAAGSTETRVPVRITGGVGDVRALSLTVAGQFGTFLGVEKGSLLSSYTTPVTIMARSQGNRVFVDMAVMGLSNPGLASDGDLFVLRFEGSAHVGIASAEFRNSQNKALEVTLDGANGQVPVSFELSQNYPNPFNPRTGIRYQVPGASDVKITVYDMLGREVSVLVNERKLPGNYEASFDGSGLASGVYYYRLTAGSFVQTRAMMLVK
jgi:hypothetical protein